ncbi:MAG: class I SAM-dependent methyltransferase [Cyanobacteria bacterium P01_A01_bin.84]
MRNNILQEQISYYKARAQEYDEWFYRIGRYDRGEENNQRWFSQIETVQTALHGLGKFESILELACGTGIWTKELINMGKSVTAVDASEEVIQINKNKLNSLTKISSTNTSLKNIEYQQLDLFSWEPEKQYELVLFAFWLSHIPPNLLDEFFDKVYRSVLPQGQIFIIDSRWSETSSAINHDFRNGKDIYQQRKLNNGEEFQIVKVYYQSDLLQEKLQKAGFKIKVEVTPDYFIYIKGTKS